MSVGRHGLLLNISMPGSALDSPVEPAMMVMNERIRDLQEMASAASNRRASLRRKLELSEEVARRRELAERSAMSAEDGKELLMREFHGSTRPMEPAGHPPGERESSDSEVWGGWRAEDARPAEAAPEATATAPKGAKAKEKSKKKKDKRKASAPAKSRQLLKKAKQVAETTVSAVDKELENRGQPGSSTDLPPHVESAMEATLEEAGGDKSLLQKARTKLGAATFAEMNVKVKELEVALAEAGGVDFEAGDVEVVDLEKEEEKSPGSVVPTTPVKMFVCNLVHVVPSSEYRKCRAARENT
eukprot:s8926_g2.t1